MYKKKYGHLWFVRRAYKSTRLHEPFATPEFYAELARAQSGVPSIPKKRCIRNLIVHYRRSDKFTTKAPRTKRDYDKILTFLTDRMGDIDPQTIERRDIIRLRDANMNTLRFANYCVQIMRILMEYAIDIGWLKNTQQNPAKGVALLKSNAPPRQPWTDDLIQKYRAFTTGRSLLIFEILLGTGQRIGDVLKMRWSDVKDDGIVVARNKTGKELWIPFTPRLKALLSVTPRRGIFILTNANATGPWSYRAAAGAVHKVRVKIGAENYDIHALRHTAASELFAAGCSDEQVRAITGHDTTASILRYGAKARQKSRAKEAQEKRCYD